MPIKPPSLPALPVPAATEPASAQPLEPGAERKRMLVVVNPHATTVSAKLKNLVVYALQARYEVEAIETEASRHAIEIGRRARDEGFDVVVAFGGDGTLNEVANGLAGSGVAVSVLPGGATNVVCRTLGIPLDVVDATERLIALADDFHPRPIDLGSVNGRRFVFASGVGLDASVVRAVDSRPSLKAKAGPWFYSYAALTNVYGGYVRHPQHLVVEAEGEQWRGVTAIAQNSDPYSYFGSRPVRVCEGVEIDDGALGVAVLERVAQRDIATLVPRLLSAKPVAHKARSVAELKGVKHATVRALANEDDGEARPLPVHVDGDYIGDYEEVVWEVEPGALMLVA